ncbi:Ig-like domain-containing protein [Peribacillus sp. R9-11]|uniref:Ig-like domain-containing protein n=1 Tax=Peribacillus sp. R9-11 TaxID=3073271 RepID=UPI0028695993|nr:Ig-like domain-containing protein [Peribacillus sp. R9-11]WMX58054.1 Ig-like domain-containing protein [Peribacillus sp. R9-11]
MKWLLKWVIIVLICIISGFSINPVVKAESTKPNISFSIISPTSNTTKNDELKVIISKPNSTYQVSQVKAKVEGKEILLTYDNNAYGEHLPGWVGTLNLNGLSRGIKTLEVTVYDVYGNAVAKQTTFKYTQPPGLNIISPKSFDFTNGKLRITAEASDLAGETSTIGVYASSNDEGYGTKLLERVNRIDETVDISKYNGKEIYMTFVVSNESGGTFTTTREIYVDNSPLLSPKDRIDGEILDYKDNKILYRTNNDIRIKDLHTTNETLVFSHSINKVDYGFLTPLGVMLVVQNVDPYYISNSLYEYKNGTLTYLGRLNSNSSLKVNGHYAIWNGDLKPLSTPGIASGVELYLKNLESDNITLVSNEAGNWMNNVTSNGDVIYWSGYGWNGSGDTIFNYNIYKYSNGNTSRLSSDGSYFNVYPVSDGSLTVYERHRYNENTHFLILNVDGKDETIATSSNDFSPGRDYTINNGYVAYTNYINGTKQIFIWKDGISNQITYLGSDTSIVSLNANGDVIARFSNGYYFIKNDGSQPIKLYTIGLNNYWVNNELYGVIGGELLRIETKPVIVTGVTLSKTNLELKIGEEFNLTANVLPSNATNQRVKWESNHSDIAAIDGTGKIIAKKEGTATITVTTEDGIKTASCTVVIKDVTAPSIPTVNTVYDNATVITGKAESNAKVYATVGSKKIGETAAKNGQYTIKIAKQKAGTTIVVYAKDTSGNKSGSKTVKVIDKTAPSIPTVNNVYDNATVITGKAELNAKVYAMVGSKKIGETTAKNGQYTIKIAKQKAGTTIVVYAKDTSGNKSGSKKVKVIDKTAPSVPTVNKITSKTVTVTGKGEKGASIYIYNGSKKIGQGIVDSRGNFKVKIKAQKKGSSLKVYAQDKSGNKSKSKTVKVS